MEKKEPLSARPGKADRISQHLTSASRHMLDWLDLKVVHTQRQVRLELEARRPLIVAGILAVIGGLLLLVAASLGLGAVLGQTAWGFVVTGSAVLLGAAVLRVWYGRRSVHRTDQARLAQSNGRSE